MNQRVLDLTEEEQTIFDAVVGHLVERGAVDNLRVAVGWTYSVNLFKIVMVCDNYHYNLVDWKWLPRSVELHQSSMTTHTTEVHASVLIHRFMKEQEGN